MLGGYPTPGLWLFDPVHFEYDGNWTGGGTGAGLKINCLFCFSVFPFDSKDKICDLGGCHVCYGFSQLSDTNYELYHYY